MDESSEISRRKFLEIGIYAIGGSIAAASTVTLARFAVGPSFEKERHKWIEADIKEATGEELGFQRLVIEYQARDGWLTAMEKRLACVRRTSSGGIIAISAICTHLGCIVTWDVEQKIFKCPCHNGRYDSEGRVISGPPPAPLYRHKTKVEDGKVFVSTERVPYGDDTRA
ncbi:MAG: ubiquinol-cytochrome c reductase iron-sulfur subunit [Deltaproteobacteria bacterium]|nr:ubiquinol-cytochrome c reductase iron-sulfur subunit [Deltaproteobacteria bacterium]